MNVSLCGPHSFETSTLPLTVVERVLSVLASPPLSRMNSYLLHQVGSCELFWALTLSGRFDIPRLSVINPKTTSIDRRNLFLINFSLCSYHFQFGHPNRFMGVGFYRKSKDDERLPSRRRESSKFRL